MSNQEGFNVTSGGYWFADKLSSAGDVNGDGYCDIIVSEGIDAYDRVYVIFGGPSEILQDFNIYNMTDKQGFTIKTGEYRRGSVSSADLNNDGYSDVIIGAKYYDGFTYMPIVYVVFGSSSITNLTLDNMTDSQGFGIMMKTAVEIDMFVSNAGDVNGDGYQDMILADLQNPLLTAFVIYGGNSLHSFYLAYMTKSQGFQITGYAVDDDYWITSVNSAGDVNNDGYADILIATAKGYYSSAHIIYGGKDLDKVNMTEMTLDQGFNITNDFRFAIIARPAGDFNKDGYADLIICVPLDVDGGKDVAYLIYGARNLQSFVLKTMTEKQGVKIYGYGSEYDSRNYFGDELGSAGDFNRDGYDDIMIRAPRENFEAKLGATFVIFGGPTVPASFNVHEMDCSQGLKFIHPDDSAVNYLNPLVLAGDLNNDGFSDIALRTHRELRDLRESAVTVIFGRLSC